MIKSIHFAHGNGFPSPCYSQLLQILQAQYSCHYIDRIGHNPQFPVTENWHCLVDEVRANVQAHCQAPVIGLGHSLGGVLSLMAAIENPSLFKAVIMIDSPLLNRFKSTMVRFAKALGFIDHVTPAGRTKGRRHHWQTREQLWRYLKTKPLFQSFTDVCLNDYIDFGFNNDEKGYSLRFDKQIEYKIFRSIPHKLHRYENKLQVPALLIYGEHSDVVDRFDVRYMRKNYGIHCVKMKGSHMLPMENPDLLGELILNQLEILEREGDWLQLT